MTYSDLTRPECTLWSNAIPMLTFTNNGDGFMTERDFRKKLNTSDFAAITCVASTDKADTRRVVLNLVQGMGFMVLNFPSANGKLNSTEKGLLAKLRE